MIAAASRFAKMALQGPDGEVGGESSQRGVWLIAERRKIVFKAPLDTFARIIEGLIDIADRLGPNR